MKPVKRFDILKNKLTVEDLQQYVCAFINALCSIEFSMAGEQIRKKISEISAKYKAIIDIPTSKSIDLLGMSWNKITNHEAILKVPAK